MPLQVLYEDNHLIAVYKPAGVLVQGDVTGDPTLMDEVKYYLKQKYHKTGKVFLGLLHRLDRNVQGIILFAKTSKGASRLSEQFRNHTVEKIYHAVVEGKLKKEKETLVHFLTKDENTNRTTVHRLQTTGSQRADLSYEVVKSNGKYSLLKVKLGTGRSHQIRAQLGYIGSPIVGDVKYGASKQLPNQVLALAATSLAFATATTSELVIVEVPIPKDFNSFI
ncbi:MAG: RluA family pseudouridine synthase [Candidatus Magasanikbacteria bacterium]|nr:RluA family pseudouridine synthase [Candidatus Magasanikbacteria bacterium]